MRQQASGNRLGGDLEPLPLDLGAALELFGAHLRELILEVGDEVRLVYLSDYGIPVELVDNESWLNQHLANVDESNALFPLRPFYLPVTVIDDLPALIDTSNTAPMMKELGLSYTSMDKVLFFKYFDYLGSWLTET